MSSLLEKLKVVNLIFVITSITTFYCYGKTTNKIIVAAHVEPPFMIYKSGTYTGRNAVVVRLLATSIKKDIDFKPCSFGQCLNMMEQGKADLIVDIRQTPERQNYLQYLETPLYSEVLQMNYYSLHDDPKIIQSYQDLKNLNIGVLGGASYYNPFDQDKSLNKTETNNHQQLVTMLLRKRIDVFIGREESIKAQAEKYIYENKIKIAPYKIKQKVAAYIAISKKSSLVNYSNVLSKNLISILNREEIKPLFPQ
nr:transporter substrate-binding domain-containing protein [Paraglaciecola sp. G1-23]